MVTNVSKLAMLAGITLCSSECFAQRYFVQTRVPQSSWYLSGYADWIKRNDAEPDVHGNAVELRGIWPNDIEVAVRGQWLRADSVSGSEKHSDFGDSTLSIVKGWRDIGAIDYFSVEYGELLTTAPRALRSNIDRYGRLRIQGGATRAGFDISVLSVQLREPDENNGTHAYTGSFGFRSQWGQLHLGADVNVTTAFEGGPSTTADLIATYRQLNGNSIYAIVEKGIHGDSRKYASIGYEFRF